MKHFISILSGIYMFYYTHNVDFGLCRLSILPDLDNMAQDIRKALESCQKELKSTQEQKSCIEKECIVYKSQLEVLN